MDTLTNDSERKEFLEKLDDSEAAITDWEARFIESNIKRISFTDGQRTIIDGMYTKYQNFIR